MLSFNAGKNSNITAIKETIEINQKERYFDYELNSFSYEKAFKNDKRTFFQFYISLLKQNHLLLFSFYPSNDYNPMVIKINLFFFSFSLFYFVNALFFNDSTMHKIYEDEGIFNFIYFFPIMIYSNIISSVIINIIKILALPGKTIIKVKNENNKEKLGIIGKKIVKVLKIKFICFYGVSFFLLILFWYYLSCFCAAYKKTQIYLIKDTLIGFGLSLIYPLIYNLLPGLLRISTLIFKDKCLNCCYKISVIIS